MENSILLEKHYKIIDKDGIVKSVVKELENMISGIMAKPNECEPRLMRVTQNGCLQSCL